MSSDAVSATQQALAVLVVKQGVGLGTLTHPQRLLALGVAAAALDGGPDFTEAQVNAALKAWLAGPAAFLDTDHVELRRWLVDTGWWRRDGYGRACTRVPAAELVPELRAIDAAIARLSLAPWIASQRERVQAQRLARRQAWAQQGGAPAPGQSG